MLRVGRCAGAIPSLWSGTRTWSTIRCRLSRGIVRHLRQAATAVQIAAAIERSSFKRLSEQEQRVGFSEKTPRGSAFFRVGRHGQWRDKLTSDQVGSIVRKHHVQMRNFGYLTPDLEVHLAREMLN